MKKFLASVVIFVSSFIFINICFAQSPSPSASPAVKTVAAIVSSPPAAQSGVMAWVESHGGFQAAVLMLVSGFLGILSAVRMLLYKLDGVAQGSSIPVDYKGLTVLNKVCLVLGSVVDFFTGNMAH
jgi:hypothetical protein